jgi:hypothetical protein
LTFTSGEFSREKIFLPDIGDVRVELFARYILLAPTAAVAILPYRLPVVQPHLFGQPLLLALMHYLLAGKPLLLPKKTILIRVEKKFLQNWAQRI